MAGDVLTTLRAFDLLNHIQDFISKSDLGSGQILVRSNYSLANSSSGISWEILFAISSLAL